MRSSPCTTCCHVSPKNILSKRLLSTGINPRTYRKTSSYRPCAFIGSANRLQVPSSFAPRGHLRRPGSGCATLSCWPRPPSSGRRWYCCRERILLGQRILGQTSSTEPSPVAPTAATPTLLTMICFMGPVYIAPYPHFLPCVFAVLPTKGMEYISPYFGFEFGHGNILCYLMSSL